MQCLKVFHSRCQELLIVLVVVVLHFSLANLSSVANEKTSAAEALFAFKVEPLLKSKCLACHGDDPEDLRGDFDMRTRQATLRGGESEEPAIVVGNAADSPLYRAVRWEDLEMPPKENDRLNAEQIKWVAEWINAGAPWPTADRLAAIRKEDWSHIFHSTGVMVPTSGGESDQWKNRLYDPADLWAFRSFDKPSIPEELASPSGNPIDAFINRKIAAAKIDSAERADARTLLRRLTFSLTGLPPTPRRFAEFLRNSQNKSGERIRAAFAKEVDRLLDTPQYGEQMAKHWLDVVRYADSAGFANDFSRPNAWRYRDYVIRSFNSDKPYDEFVTEQIAGDEIYDRLVTKDGNSNANDELLIAPGFLRMGPWEHTAMSVAAVTRQQWLDDVTNSVGETFLANSLRCCKCHDHKFDPLPTEDYYRVQAVFAPVQFADRNVPFLDSENTSAVAKESKRIKALSQNSGIEPVLPKDASKKDRDFVGLGVNKVKRKQSQILTRALNAFKPQAFGVYNGSPRNYVSNSPNHPVPPKRGSRIQEIFILTGGSLESPTKLVGPGILSVVESPTSATAEENFPSTHITQDMKGRREQLAHWITNPRNPLTARVIVNRVWQWHFGTGLAANPNNFGKTGAKPTHPELLNWLADYLVENDWSLKQLHRLILNSDVYARSSRHPDPSAAAKVDSGNQWLSWFPARRLTAEELRDAMLATSGELNLESGGIPIRPEINMEVAVQPRHVMGSVAPAYQPSRTPEQRNRRSIYALKIRTLRDPMLEVFDQPGPDLSCERRDESTVTPQVFSLFNGMNSYDRAIAMAIRITKDQPDNKTVAAQAFQLAFGRNPKQSELNAILDHVSKQTKYHESHPPTKSEYPKTILREMVEEMTGLSFQWREQMDIFQNYVPDAKPWDVFPETRAWADICLILFNSNEFVYLY